jgi:hypothetical protein
MAYDSGSLTISSITTAPKDILRLTTPDRRHPQSQSLSLGSDMMGGGMGMDAFEHDLGFDGDGLL